MEAIARLLSAQALESLGEHQPFVIAIDGPGCSGKSTLADHVAAFTKAVVLSADDFHTASRSQSESGAALPYRRWSSFVLAARTLCAGRATVIEPFDWQNASLGAPLVLQPSNVVLLEGIATLHPDVLPLAHLRIWVDSHAPTRLARVAERDGAAVAATWSNYIPFEQSYLRTFRPWRVAHVLVLGAGLNTRNTIESFSRLIDDGAVAA